jgi:F0F1-type ATP synthase assembly protein I
MSDSIFDWDDDDEEQKPEPPAALIPYEPDPSEKPPQPAEHRWNAFDDKANPLEIEPAPFEYSSDPFQPPPASHPEDYPDPFQYQADVVDTRPEAAESDPDRFTFDPDAYAHEVAANETNQYPFGFEPQPFEAAPQTPEYQPESKEETSRRSGLAFSAGIVFFSSVVFMLFLGWIADLLLGSKPWGLVGGIILGSFIGLLQFIRITSRIFNSDKSDAAMRPLLPPDDEP